MNDFNYFYLFYLVSSDPTDKRIFVVAAALNEGYTVDKLYDLTKENTHSICDSLTTYFRFYQGLLFHPSIFYCLFLWFVWRVSVLYCTDWPLVPHQNEEYHRVSQPTRNRFKMDIVRFTFNIHRVIFFRFILSGWHCQVDIFRFKMSDLCQV